MPHMPDPFAKKLIVDLGNTRAKLAVFIGDKIHDVQFFDPNSSQDNNPEFVLKPFLTSGPFSACIISSVSTPTAPLRALLADVPVVEFTPDTPVPIQNHYHSPSTLGADRLAAAVAAHGLYPDNDVLVIDAGTAITYEFINKEGAYQGGGITAGVSMRLKSLNTFTSRLPLVEAQFPGFLIGRNSEESILSGVMNGIRAEMDGIIQEYKQLYPGLITLFTGGDMFYFEKKLKNDIFATPNLVLTGLNLILEYNLEK